ncbi:MAG: hypothetical protein PVG48_04225 [Candidatus Bathyarchaeota archaeon]
MRQKVIIWGFTLRESSFEIRAVPIWHVIILMMLSLFVIVGAYAVLKNIAGGIIILAFFGSLFAAFFYSVLFSRILMNDEGIRYRIYYVSFDEISEIKLRWGGRLMTYGKKLDLGYILLNPKEFVEAVKVIKPEALAEYRSQ